MQITTVESVVIPIGSYDAKVLEVTEQEGNFGPQLKWQFEVISPEEYAGHKLVAWTSTSPSLKSKLVKWIAACLGRQIGAGETLKIESVLGKRVALSVVVQEGTDGGEFNRVHDVKPRKAKAPVSPTPAESDDDDEGADDDEDAFGDE